MIKKPLVTVVVGPTAVGKTAYAIEQAAKVGGAVISADSRQLYAGMNIGTAKPQAAWNNEVHGVETADIVDGVPHYLFNVASPETAWTLPQWQQAAYRVLQKLTSEGVPVWIVGGTMLYVDSVVLAFDIPEVLPNPELRERLEQESAEKLYEQLMARDPAASAFIEQHHKQRIIRALEVINATGKPFSATRKRGKSPYDFAVTGLFPGDVAAEDSWKILRERITTRAQAMMDEGLVEEVAALQDRYSPTLPLLKTMNYIQGLDVLMGRTSVAEAIASMVAQNMKYTRRQMSWWKKRHEIQWFSI